MWSGLFGCIFADAYMYIDLVPWVEAIVIVAVYIKYKQTKLVMQVSVATEHVSLLRQIMGTAAGSSPEIVYDMSSDGNGAKS
jgi:hypothetical protein